MKRHLLFFLVSLLLAAGTLSIAQAQPAATVRMDSVWGCPGEIVEIPVRVYGISELGLNAFTFEFQIDTAFLEPILVSWDPDRNQGLPMILDWDPELLRGGSFRATNFYLGNGRSNLAITWLDGTFGEPNFKREDGSILFKLNIRIKKTPIEPAIIELFLANMYYDLGKNYGVTRTNGHILAKDIPNVKIDRTLFDNPFYDAFGVNLSDVSICINNPLPLTVSGAERYVWESYRQAGSTNTGHFPSGQEQLVLDQTDVFNPLFTPREASHATGWFTLYHFKVRGYNSDGCEGVDSVRIRVQLELVNYLAEQPNYIIVNKGDVIDLNAVLLPDVSPAGTHYYSRHSFRWFPEEMVENPRDSATQSFEINQPVWFWAEVRSSVNGRFAEVVSATHGCVQTLNIRVDIREEIFRGELAKSAGLFCGIPGQTEHKATLAALIEGGSDKKEYIWEYRSLYGGQEPEFSNFSTNAVDLTFFGTTEVTVTVRDPETLRELVLTDTLFVETQKTMSIRIDMDEASQRQYEIGYCVDMPLTLLATVENAGTNYSVSWEVDGYRATQTGLIAHFPTTKHQGKYRAVLHSTQTCVTESFVFSNVIDPNSEWYEITGIWMNNLESQTSECNSGLADIRFTAHNMGTNPIFQIYRNNELLEEFVHTQTNSIIDRKVETLNFWDRFNVRLINTSTKCLNVNHRLSPHVTPNLKTNSSLNMLRVVSDLGGDTICDSPDGIYTFRLTGMEQFAEHTTVIWMLNDKEWGRYEFDPTLAESFEGQLPEKHNGSFVINEDNNELSAFAQGYAFHVNAENFPKVGETFTPNDSLWVIVITRAMCPTEQEPVRKNFAGIVPKFVPLNDALLIVAPYADLNVCKGSDLTFSATVKNVNFGTVSWYLNDRKMSEGTSFTATRLLDKDSVVAVLESGYRCATNLPLRSPAKIITAHDLPKITVVKDTTICNGESIQLPVETSATIFAWAADPTLNDITVKQPIATPNNNTVQIYTITALDENGCKSSETLTVRTAPKVDLSANIWLTNLADTIICTEKLVQMQSEFFPADNQAQRRWFRNGFSTMEIGPMINSSTIRNGDVWSLQVTYPSLNTCMSRTVVSNHIEFRVELPVQTRIVATETTLCPGDSALLTAQGGAHHIWTSNDPTFVQTAGESIFVKPNTETKYHLQAFGPQSLCFSRDSITIAVQDYTPVNVELQLNPQHYQNNCATADGGYMFVALPTNPGTNARYDWYINGTLFGYTIGNPTFGRNLNPGDKIHTVMTANVVSCRSNIATSNVVEILARPNNPMVDDQIVCQGELTTLVIKNAQPNVTYSWYSSEDYFVETIGTGIILSNKPVAQYLVLAVAENGCENLDQIFVSIEQGEQPQPNIVLLTKEADVQTREIIRFRNESTNWVRAFWTFGNEPEEENHSFEVEHTFTTIETHPVVIRLVSRDDCEAIYQMDLKVNPGLTGVFVPSGFIPSSSNPEDQVLKVYSYAEFISLRFTVYTMDGRELFTTTNPQIGWDGRSGGHEMPTGNYSYVVVARLSTGEEITRSGTAMLIR